MSTPDERLGCSTITFRHRSLAEALHNIVELGFREIDLGALPGVCDHVPFELDDAGLRSVTAQVAASGLSVRSVNADVGDLNHPLTGAEQSARDRHMSKLIDLARMIGSRAVVLPCGRLSREPIVDEAADLELIASQLHRAAEAVNDSGIELWVEALHSLRFCHTARRAGALAQQLDSQKVGVVYDISHVVSAAEAPRAYLDALQDRVVHVHLRDAVPGDIHRSIGAGVVDFRDLITSLAENGYRGHFALELETSDVTENDRPAATARASDYITDLLSACYA